MKNKYDIFYDKDNLVYQVRTKNNCVVIDFSGDDGIMEEIFKDIIELYRKQDFYTFSQINNVLNKKYSYEKIYDVVNELIECELLNDDNFEDSENVFNIQQPKFTTDFANLDLPIGLIGESTFIQLIKGKLKNNGVNNVLTLDSSKDISEEVLSDFVSRAEFIIHDQILFNPNLTKTLNQYALNSNKPWLLIEGPIDNLYFSIGPIFHGKTTGCYECYLKRVLSNDENALFTSKYINYLSKHNRNAKFDPISNLVLDIASSVVVFDLLKFLTMNGIPQTWRNVLLYNSNNYNMEKHYFLKAPVCTTCNPQLAYIPSVWQEKISL
ncbi:TOMM precursor leader peptide-binding protein [uncultured Bacteroides sp.]|uniref:TOMM precursor leader peptide-binding protein n=1 Tax=uncultured Bacteroides sp. TaxID=162156 RepID=UPI0025983D1E|nr:TOMM precursor leader peptide-binding protein [uncultured Bacteroides sp.]